MRRHAFTMIELIVVLALIAVLAGTIIVAMSGVRASADRVESVGALRQIISAYNQYSHDHDGRLLPGYIDETLLADNDVFGGLRVSLPNGKQLEDEDAQSYVWRLAPYVGDAWATFFVDTDDSGAVAAMAADFGDGLYGPYGTGHAYPGGISERPTYGLNSIFVGGDSWHGGVVSGHHPWQNLLPRIAATRLSQSRKPERLIVFGPAAKAAQSGTEVYVEPTVGFCELRAPYLWLEDPDSPPTTPWDMPQWSVGDLEIVYRDGAGEYTNGAGLPIARADEDGRMPVANLDGSCEIVAIYEISVDMRRWSATNLVPRAITDPSPVQ